MREYFDSCANLIMRESIFHERDVFKFRDSIPLRRALNVFTALQQVRLRRFGISDSSSFRLVMEIFGGNDFPVQQDIEVRDDQTGKEKEAAKHIQGVLNHCPLHGRHLSSSNTTES